MVSRAEKQKLLRRKLQALKSLTRSQAEKKSDIVMDALNYITELKLKVEEMTKELSEPIAQPPTPEVKVGELEEERCFMVRVNCEKAQDLLVGMIEAFEKSGLDILHADINTNMVFEMEAIIEAEDESVDAEYVTQTIYEVLGNKGVRKP